MIRDYNVYLVDAFTKEIFQGNPAGVVMVEEKLKDHEMQKIAGEIKASETAFIEMVDIDQYSVRFFTPVEEVDLCGHATIATFYTMAKCQYIHSIENGIKKVIQHTKAGKLPVYIEYNKGEVVKVTMEQASPEDFGELKNLEKLADALNIKVEDIGIEGLDLRPEIISTGIKDVMLPVKSRDVISKIVLNPKVTMELNEEEDFYSIHAFYYDSENNKTYQRNFCPILEIDEEAATGTSTGAMLHYLDKHKLLRGNSITAIQGVEMNRPSVIYGEILNSGGKKIIKIGGSAAIVIEGIIELK